MASLRKRGKTWRAEVMVGEVRESATFDSKAGAVAWATRTEGELRAHRRGEIIPRSVKQALERYRDTVSPTHRGGAWEKVRLNKLARTVPFAHRKMQDVQRSDIAAWRDSLLLTLATSSARREFGLLRAVFAIAIREWGWLHLSPFDHVTPPKEGEARTRRVSDAEVNQILVALNYTRGAIPETASQFIGAAMLLGLETAMRLGELLSLDRDQVDLAKCCIHLDKTKNGDKRDIPLSNAALAVVALLPSEGPLFRVALKTCDTLFRRARDAAGLGGATGPHFHDLRREATTRLSTKLDVLTLAKVTGHRDVKVLLRTYYAPNMADIAARLN